MSARAVPPPDGAPLLLTIPEVAGALKMKSTDPVYRLIARGQLPAVQVCGRSRVDAKDLQQYLDANKRVA
jgi:excisionase family DNA binding protein